ncbi:MAG: GntR family transcriptional regulator [Pseudomonadota bacterium]
MIPARKETCREELINRILTLEIAPGSLLDETELSNEFDLSRTPLREVIQSLAGDGFLTLVRNRGAKVSSMDFESMRSFFQTAPMVYSAIGRLAAENAGEVQIEELRLTQQKFRAACEGGETHHMAIHNHRFHELIGEMAGNSYLTPSLRRLLIDHTRMSQKFYKPVNSKERLMVWDACDQHDALIKAIEENDVEAIVQFTMDHWELSRNRIEKFAKPDPLSFDLEETG